MFELVRSCIGVCTMTNVLGIVGCQVLEDEMAYIVAKDPEFRNVLVIDSTEERTLAGKVQRMAPEKQVSVFDESVELKDLNFATDPSVILWNKSICLHQSPTLLREEVLKAINKMEPVARAVLIFYGQCGSAFVNMDIISEGIHVPVTILKDKDGSLIDDCFGTFLGGKEEYRLFLVNQHGPSYILNSMWAANWRHFMKEFQMIHDPNDLEEAREVFKYMDYKRVVGLNTGLVDPSVFEEQLKEFSTVFELEPVNRDCTLSIVEMSYQEAKRFLMEQPQ